MKSCDRRFGRQVATKMLGTFLTLLCVFCACHAYTIDDSNGVERTFDGIGGLSGGGVSEK